jgi:hypothetical protein
MSTAIKVENLSKIYRLGEIGTGTISRDLERWYKTKLLGKEDPFLKIGESNDRSKKGASDIVYSLKDINFEIEQGDAVGMSTVPEVIFANHMSMKVFGASIIADCGYPFDKMKVISHQEVLEKSAEAEPKVTNIVKHIIQSF